MALSPEERKLRASLAGAAGWARTPDRSARAARMQEGLDASLARKFGIPDGLSPEAFAKALASARKAHFTQLSFRAAKARREAAEARRRNDGSSAA